MGGASTVVGGALSTTSHLKEKAEALRKQVGGASTNVGGALFGFRPASRMLVIFAAL